MNRFAKLFFCSILFFFATKELIAKNIWVLDKELSDFRFELPVLLNKNVEGKFTIFDGSVVIDLENEENNRAFFFVEIYSMELNYHEYKDLLLSNTFF